MSEFRCQRCRGPRKAGDGWCKACHAIVVGEIKKRIAIKPGCNYPDKGDALSVELHIFFVHLLETEEMLEKLKKDKERPKYKGPAVSKIETTTLTDISPIDRVAARVTRPQ